MYEFFAGDYDVALARAADGGVAGHIAHGVKVNGEADRFPSQPRACERGFNAGMAPRRGRAARRRYQQIMKHTLEQQENLTLRQAEIVELRVENGAVSAVVTATGAVFGAKAVILCSGTYLDGRTIVGECIQSSGPDGMHASLPLAEQLRALGLPPAPLQDRHAPARQRPQRRFLQNGAAGRRRRAAAVLVHDRARSLQSGGVLPHLHERGDTSHHPRKSRPQPPSTPA